VILPKNNANLGEVLKNLPKIGIKNMIETMSIKPGFVTMPCFQIRNITDLKTVLQEVRSN
jgi:serine protease inhibitor